MDQALTTAEALFHEKGYDAVGVAALTEAIGINPPSFYVAFGSKAALFERVMDRYVAEGLRLDAFVSPETTPAEAIRAYLRAAARLYAACPRAPGCLVFEAARGAEGASSTSAARQRKQACWARIEAYVVQTHPATAAIVADAVVTILSGMSAGAREGWDEARLLDVATTASAGIADALASGRSSEPHQINALATTRQTEARHEPNGSDLQGPRPTLPETCLGGPQVRRRSALVLPSPFRTFPTG